MPEVATKEKTKYIAELEMCLEKNGRRIGKIIPLDPVTLEASSDDEAVKTAEEYAQVQEDLKNMLAMPSANTAERVVRVRLVRNQTNKRTVDYVGHVSSNY